MKRELESVIMGELKKGYCPVYGGEEGYILISMKAYLAAAEYAGAEYPCFWYDDLYYDMIDVESREDEIEGGHFNFMPRKEECKFKVGDIICPTPEADRYYDYTGTNMISADDIFSDLEDIELVYRAINEKIILLGGSIANLLYNTKNTNSICEYDRIQDIMLDMERYEKILSRIVEYEKVRKQMEVKKE